MQMLRAQPFYTMTNHCWGAVNMTGALHELHRTPLDFATLHDAWT